MKIINPQTAKKWRQETQDGWVFLEQMDGSTGRYRHSCNHIQNIPAATMRLRKPPCGGCQASSIAWSQHAQDHGWEFVARLDGNKGSYRHPFKANGTVCGNLQEVAHTKMHSGRVECHGCESHETRWAAEAEAIGWQFLEQKDRHHGIYRHLLKPDGTVCGHTKESQAVHVRNGSLMCDNCQNPRDRWTKEAQALGWVLLETQDVKKNTYRHLLKADGTSCGHEQSVFTVAMRAGKVKCGACGRNKAVTARPRPIQDPPATTLLKREGEAATQGWELVRTIDGKKGLFRHFAATTGKGCRHEQIFYFCNMQAGTVRCKSCKSPLIGWSQEATAAGWALVNQVDGAQGRYRHLSKPDGTVCGSEQVAQARGMRSGSVRCKKCSTPQAGWRRDADVMDWEFIRQIDTSYARFRHRHTVGGLVCGHEQSIHVGAMRKGSVLCECCGDHRIGWQRDAEVQGWDFVAQEDGTHGRYRHQTTPSGTLCLHEQIVTATNMRNGEVRCQGCQDPIIQWALDADANGYDFLKNLDGVHGRFRHRCKPDGTPCRKEQVLHAVTMRRGSARCLECGDPGVSHLHQEVGCMLQTLAPEGLHVHPEYPMGLKPALTDGGKDGRTRSDFFLQYKTIRIILEIDGAQHFMYTPGWHRAHSEFLRQIHRDVFVELDAQDQEILVLRFGSWEKLETVKAALQSAIQGSLLSPRLAESIPGLPSATGEQFWAEREKARESYLRRKQM